MYFKDDGMTIKGIYSYLFPLVKTTIDYAELFF
jgi:hypothetical protein